jgi:hypothetical protein
LLGGNNNGNFYGNEIVTLKMEPIKIIKVETIPLLTVQQRVKGLEKLYTKKKHGKR